eukprot:991026-Prymnesium_polylepis.1
MRAPGRAGHGRGVHGARAHHSEAAERERGGLHSMRAPAVHAPRPHRSPLGRRRAVALARREGSRHVGTDELLAQPPAERPKRLLRRPQLHEGLLRPHRDRHPAAGGAARLAAPQLREPVREGMHRSEAHAQHVR